MTEQIDLNNPVNKTPLNNWKVYDIYMRRTDGPIVTITFKGNDGSLRSISYTDEPTSPRTATSVIKFVNTANFSTNSMDKRIFQNAIIDFPNVFAGTISGVPDA